MRPRAARLALVATLVTAACAGDGDSDSATSSSGGTSASGSATGSGGGSSGGGSASAGSGAGSTSAGSTGDSSGSGASTSSGGSGTSSGGSGASSGGSGASGSGSTGGSSSSTGGGSTGGFEPNCTSDDWLENECPDADDDANHGVCTAYEIVLPALSDCGPACMEIGQSLCGSHFNWYRATLAAGVTYDLNITPSGGIEATVWEVIFSPPLEDSDLLAYATLGGSGSFTTPGTLGGTVEMYLRLEAKNSGKTVTLRLAAAP
jgi:hypothetical protein